MRQTLSIALVAVVLLAGCSAGPAGDAATPTPDGTDAPTTADSPDATGDETTTTGSSSTDDGDASTEGSAGVDFYLSDRPSVIGEFDHLNVTVSKVGVHRAGAADNATENGSENDPENGSEAGEWLEFDVNATADLTRLQGANASKLGTLDLPNGSYTKVFVYVSETEGVIDGENKRVKLPSGKLQLNKGFTVGDGSDVDFVFDITVHRAGNSGKYVLSPVVAESGTGDEVEIRDVDADEAETDENEADETETATDDSNADGEGVTTAASTATETASATTTATPAA